MNERDLLRADVEGYSYSGLLEAAPGSLRFLRPGAESRRTVRIVSTTIALAWLFVFGPLFAVLLQHAATLGFLEILALIAYVAVFSGTLVAAEVWWSGRNLPLLADRPAQTIDVKVLGLTSFGTFQEIRAAGPTGQLRITVEGRPERVARALRLAGALPPASA